MLKAMQTFGCCSGHFLSQRLKNPYSSNGFLLLSPSTPSSRNFVATYSPSIRRSCFENGKKTRVYATQSESDSAGSSSSVSVSSAGNNHRIKFCQWCGSTTKHEVPEGDEKIRAICTHCGKVAYQNPKMVVGCVIEHEKKVLLCKRNIEPSHGLWTLPAGYLEVGESAAEGATRETWEEAGADVEVLSPFAHLDIPLIGQTYVIFLAKLKKPEFSPGPESSDCRLFELDRIPFNSLAFSSILVTLKLYVEDVKSGSLKFHYGVINKRPGTSPSEIRAFTLDHHLQI